MTSHERRAALAGPEIRPCPGFPGYAVTSDGDVLSQWELHGKGPRLLGTGYRKLKPGTNANGYRHVSLSVGGKQRSRTVHRLVLEAFVGPRPPGMQCRHGNGIQTDNRLCNLQWGTPAANQADRNLHGTSNRGERHPQSKLTAAAVLAIRRRFDSGEPPADIAKDFGIRSQTASLVGRRKSWAHLPEEANEPSGVS